MTEKRWEQRRVGPRARSGRLLGDGSSVVAASSPYIWHRADTVTLTGSDVDAWDDISGNSRTPTQTLGNRPTWNSGSAFFNGRPSLTFASASAQFLNYADSTLPASGDTEVMCVLRATQTKAASSVSAGLWTHGAAVSAYPLESGTSWIRPAFNVTAAFGDVDPSPVDITTGHLLHCWTDATGLTTTTEQNGATSVFDSSVTTSYVTTGLNLGQTRTTGRYFDGEMAEYIYWARLLTATERQQILGYIARRYGFDIGQYLLLEGSPDRYLIEGSTIDRYLQE
jgi:hypothetical protein